MTTIASSALLAPICRFDLSFNLCNITGLLVVIVVVGERLFLSGVTKPNGVHVLALTRVNTTALDKSRARSVCLDRPPREQLNRRQTALDASTAIALHLILGQTARIARSSAGRRGIISFGANYDTATSLRHRRASASPGRLPRSAHLERSGDG